MRKSYRAAVIPKPNHPVEVREYPAPEIEPGGVLLHTILSEVCGTDVHLHRGLLQGVPYPLIPGHVSVGEIAALRPMSKGPMGRGEAICDVAGTPFREGDVAAFLDVHATCGACHACLVTKQSTRCPKRKVYGITYGADEGLLGGWSEAIYLRPGVKMLRLPPGLDPETYCGGGCGLNTAMHAIDRAAIRLGDSVAVLGVGPVGQSVIAFAGLAGAGELIAIGGPEARLSFARRMGATEVIDLAEPEEARRQRVRDLTGGRGVDVVVEVAGDPEAVRQGLDLLRDGGRMVVCGQYTDRGDVSLNPHLQINQRHIEIRGCWGSDFSHFFRAIAVMARHAERFPWKEMIDARYALDDMNAALAAVADQSVVKAAVDPTLTG
jgi:threonine dehydrogenase-like Zn-dependent dehydrogenase